jgi:DnaT DNA-binding domain
VSIVRTAKRSQYVIIEHAILTDTSLSWDAKGLHCYLLSRPDDWQIRVDHLVKQGCGAGRGKIYRMLGELIACGYAERKPLRNASGRIIQHEYLVYDHKVLAKDIPRPDSPLLEKPEVANPDMGQPLVADRTLPINDKKLITNKPITSHWLPDEEAFLILDSKNIPRSFAEAAIPEFVLYWRERNENAGQWNSKFVSRVQWRWNHRDNLPMAVETPQQAFERFFDRSWGLGLVKDLSVIDAPGESQNGDDE